MATEQETDPEYDELIADLRRLGRSVPQRPAEPIADAVLARLADLPAPSPLQTWVDAVTRRRRQLLIAVAVLLLGTLGVTPVRAAVADWFGFDGVKVHLAPVPGATTRPAPPPTVTAGTSLAQARQLVTFALVTLPALGPPQGIEVAADRRTVSMSWTTPGGTVVRLDEFSGQLDYVLAKTSPDVQFVNVGQVPAMWFDRPQKVTLLDAQGRRRTETARLAGHTLIWQVNGTVLRLEGDLPLSRAQEIGGTAR